MMIFKGYRYTFTHPSITEVGVSQTQAVAIFLLPEEVFALKATPHLMDNTIYKHFKKIVASIGMPDVRFLDLRHSYAVAAIRAGDDIKTVQGNLGHATAAFTLDVYGHVTDQTKQASASRMESYIKDVLDL